MPTGDEPQLSSSQSDDAPMISGRGTAVIVTARGAYTAGNLDKLIEMLDERQQFEMQRIFARHAAEYLTRVYPQLQESHFDVVIRWADDPSDANYAAVRALGPSNTFTNGRDFSLKEIVLFPSSQQYFSAFDVFLGQTVTDISLARTVTMSLRRWYLDVAWALLTNRPIPTDVPSNHEDFAELEQAARIILHDRDIPPVE
jgi:hypothetical protein